MADAAKTTRLLLRAYPDPRIALRHRSALQLLVATLLSAQCTDQRVNEVTRELFKRYRSARDYAEADRNALEQAVRPTGFYRNKARTLINCCRKLVSDFGGRVPRTLEELTRLPGVGRKTANLVRGVAFAQQAVAVDTHVARVARRLGLSAEKDPARIEQDLMAQIPAERWTPVTLALILHGRQVCTARKPRCLECALYPACEWPEKPAADTGGSRNGKSRR
ncbi:MAG TPA: endonuclease III [Gammaproteobacteria bacterium]|nr:endonuclease III [Gammaproteobacteria bacterium]